MLAAPAEPQPPALAQRRLEADGEAPRPAAPGRQADPVRDYHQPAGHPRASLLSLGR